MKLFPRLLILIFWASQAQQDSLVETHFIKDAYLEGEVRNFFMNTNNLNESDDYFTNATGLQLKLNSGTWNNVSLGAGGRYITKTFSSPIAEVDTQTENFTKWEFELYDILNRDNFNLFFLEELYLNYQAKNWNLQVGNMLARDTPLFSRSDGRMRPFHYRGAWLDYSKNPTHQFSVAWLTHVLPRSTSAWFSINKSIGLLSNGFQPDGSQADYKGMYNSKGAGILSYQYQKSNIEFRTHQFLIHDMMYTSFLEAHYHWNQWSLGAQYAIQKGTASNKRLDYINRYIQPDETPQVLSLQLTYAKPTYSFGLAYSYALPTGRMLFPKELGREWFFTSTARSRTEGLGDMHGIVVRANYFAPQQPFSLHAEIIQMLGMKMGDYKFNKYNIDEYYQVNLRLRYSLNALKGLKFDVLYTFKHNYNENDPINVFNRSDYGQLNFVTLLYF
jgi:hypothetical protein